MCYLIIVNDLCDFVGILVFVFENIFLFVFIYVIFLRDLDVE